MLRFLFIILFVSHSVYSQVDYQAEQQKLEEKKKNIQKEIDAIRKVVKEENQKKRDIQKEINIQQKKIKLTTDLIRTGQKQHWVIENDIYLNTLEKNKLNKELKILKEDYAKIVRKSYKNRSEQSRVLFVLSSQDFLQAYKRLQYMKQYARFRKSQSDEIIEKTKKIEEINQALEIKKLKQQNIIKEQEIAKQNLEEEKKKKDLLMAELNKDIKKHNSEIKQKIAETKKIDAQIKAVVKKIMEEAKRKAEKTAKNKKEDTKKTSKTPKVSKQESSAKIDFTPEDKALANSFEANKGKMPWPLEKGRIRMHYGNVKHPDYDITTYSTGWEIETNPGAVARAIFEGEVSAINSFGGGMKMVFVRHGQYMSVYQNLSSVAVRVGQKVSTKQKIGTVKTDGEGKTILKFTLSNHNGDTMNPEMWLSR